MIRMFAEQSRAIRVPAYLAALMPVLNDARRELTQKLGRPPTTAELATRLEIDPKQVERMVRLSQRPVSLQDPVGWEEDGTTVGDMVEDLNAEDPLDAATLAFLQRYLAHVLKNLRPREQEILRLRFGLEDGRVMDAGRAIQAVSGDQGEDPPDGAQSALQDSPPSLHHRLDEFLED